MSSVAMAKEDSGRNRRENFRMNDRVALRVRRLDADEYRELRNAGETRFETRRSINHVFATRDAQRGLLRNLRDEDPHLAAYLESLDERIDALARLLSAQNTSTASRPTHDVNLSASGVRFVETLAVSQGDHVVVDLRLFPSNTCLSLLGTVVRATRRKGHDGEKVIAVDFDHVHEDDSELLIRHVHALQLDYVRRGVRHD